MLNTLLGTETRTLLGGSGDHAPAEKGMEFVTRTVAGGPSNGHMPPGFSEVANGLAGSGLAELLPFALAIGAVGALGAFLFFGGTRYITREDVLKNDVRGRIYAHLKEKVGANLKQITDDLGLTTTNAIWHLRKLEEAGLIHSRRFNGFKVFYPAEGGIQARRMSLSITALSNDNAQDVFQFVIANPGVHQREIARALGVNHGTVRWHLKKLRRAELLTEIKKGKASAYFPTDIGFQAFDNVCRNRAAAEASAPAAVVAHHA